ncbi:MAG: anaerobic ribonucleoside-triphosphate reductase activating protein [Candidatus Pacebacteria bacterium]|nr:anaerobic ribonucleoside-triphosphate reductase activating protein [Candidatus Paceibacterota bacterium]
MLIAGLQKFSLGDWAGEPACVIFLAGCNYQCPWCNYVDYFDPVAGLEEKALWKFLEEQTDKLKVCVISGGEPTIHPDLPDFLRGIKNLGYKVKLETNGSHPQMLADLTKDNLIDFISLDVKAPKEKYGFLIGFPQDSLNYLLSQIDQSLAFLKKGSVDYELKTTVGTFLTPDDVWQIVHWIKPAKKYSLINFQPRGTLDSGFGAFEPYGLEYLARLRDKIAPFFETCEVREGALRPGLF